MFPIQLSLDAFRLSAEQNRLRSIEFGNRAHKFNYNRAHRKVQVRLCSITEPIEQQSDQLGSIELDRFLVRFRSIGYAGLNSIYREQFRDSTSPEHMAYDRKAFVFLT